MPSGQTLNFNVSYTVDSELVWSVEEYLVNYLTDIPLSGLGGERMSDAAIEGKIRIATSQLEGYLSIKIPKQRLLEQYDFEREHFENWGHIKCNNIVSEVNVLRGQLNFAHQITYPKGWISIKRQIEQARNIQIVAGQQEDLQGLQSDFVAVFTGKFPVFGYSSANYIPNYWNIDYTTGFEEVPFDLQDACAKIASMQVLAILGDITFGAGIASKSISLDGLSQSLNTTQSAENSLYSARIRQFQNELKQEMVWLKNRYAGLSMMSI
jgi:hypothetical protein